MRRGVLFLSLWVRTRLLFGRTGRSAVLCLRVREGHVLPLLALVEIFLCAGGLSGGGGVVRRGWLWGVALPGGLWVEEAGTYRRVWQRAGVPRPQPIPHRQAAASHASLLPPKGPHPRGDLRGWRLGGASLVWLRAGGGVGYSRALTSPMTPPTPALLHRREATLQVPPPRETSLACGPWCGPAVGAMLGGGGG